MAEVIVRQLIDDIDGSEISDGAGERVEFSIRGVGYQIDLSSTASAAASARTRATGIEIIILINWIATQNIIVTNRYNITIIIDDINMSQLSFSTMIFNHIYIIA